MQTDQRNRIFGQGNGSSGPQTPQTEAGASAWERFKSTETMKHMFGITGVCAYEAIECDGKRVGHQMTVVTQQGSEFHVGITEEIYEALLNLHMQTSGSPSLQEEPGPITKDSLENPTGTPAEIAVMKQRLEGLEEPQHEQPMWDSGQSPMSKIGFVSDEEMEGDTPTDPVEEVLFLASNTNEEDEDELLEYGDDEFGEDIGQL